MSHVPNQSVREAVGIDVSRSQRILQTRAWEREGNLDRFFTIEKSLKTNLL